MVLLHRTGFEFEVEEKLGEQIVLHVGNREIVRAGAKQSVGIGRQHVHAFAFGPIGSDFDVRRLLAVALGDGSRREAQRLQTAELAIDLARLEQNLPVGHRRAHLAVAPLVLPVLAVGVTDVNDRSFVLPSVAHVLRVRNAAEIHLHVVEIRTGRDAFGGDGRGEHFVLAQVDLTRLLAVARENVLAGAFLDAIVDAELALLHGRLFAVPVDDAHDLDVFVLRAAQVQVDEVALLKADAFEMEGLDVRAAGMDRSEGRREKEKVEEAQHDR